MTWVTSKQMDDWMDGWPETWPLSHHWSHDRRNTFSVDFVPPIHPRCMFSCFWTAGVNQHKHVETLAGCSRFWSINERVVKLKYSRNSLSKLLRSIKWILNDHRKSLHLAAEDMMLHFLSQMAWNFHLFYLPIKHIQLTVTSVLSVPGWMWQVVFRPRPDVPFTRLLFLHGRKWMDGWMDKRMNRWMDGKTDGWTVDQTVGLMLREKLVISPAHSLVLDDHMLVRILWLMADSCVN